MRTYYSTTAEDAARILQHGFTDGVVRIGAHRMSGVPLFGWVTNPAETWLEIEIDEDVIAPYSVPGVPGEMPLWIVPARLLADHGSRRLLSDA